THVRVSPLVALRSVTSWAVLLLLASARPCSAVCSRAPTVRSTLSLPDALPICGRNSAGSGWRNGPSATAACACWNAAVALGPLRSEEHTSELQSHLKLVCRLLLEKKKNNVNDIYLIER